MKCIALNRCHRDNARTEYTTRKWKLSKNWHQERVAFDCFQMLGYLTIYTDRCNRRKLCASILTLVKLKTSAVLHGLLYEAVARQTCNARIGLKIRLVVSSYVLSTIIWLFLLLVLLEKQPNLKLHVPSMLEICCCILFSVSIWNRIIVIICRLKDSLMYVRKCFCVIYSFLDICVTKGNQCWQILRVWLHVTKLEFFLQDTSWDISRWKCIIWCI